MTRGGQRAVKNRKKKKKMTIKNNYCIFTIFKNLD